MADSPVTYAQATAEQRLAIKQAQLLEKMTEDSIVGRGLKEMKRGDYQQMVQPLYAQVELRASEGGGGRRTTPKPIGRMGKGPVNLRGGSGGGAVASASIPGNLTNWMNPGWRSRGGGAGGTTFYNTGRTTIVEKAATWTTEGAIENKFQPREQHRQKVRRSLVNNNATVYNRTGVDAQGKGIWTGTQGQLGQNGEFTPLVKLDPKTKNEQMFAEKETEKNAQGQALGDEFKKRSKDKMAGTTPTGMISTRPSFMGPV